MSKLQFETMDALDQKKHLGNAVEVTMGHALITAHASAIHVRKMAIA